MRVLSTFETIFTFLKKLFLLLSAKSKPVAQHLVREPDQRDLEVTDLEEEVGLMVSVVATMIKRLAEHLENSSHLSVEVAEGMVANQEDMEVKGAMKVVVVLVVVGAVVILVTGETKVVRDERVVVASAGVVLVVREERVVVLVVREERVEAVVLVVVGVAEAVELPLPSKEPTNKQANLTTNTHTSQSQY